MDLSLLFPIFIKFFEEGGFNELFSFSLTIYSNPYYFFSYGFSFSILIYLFLNLSEKGEGLI